MTTELGRALVGSGAVSPDALAKALHMVVTHGVPLPRALLLTGAIDEARLEAELARAEAPVVDDIEAVPELMAKLPAGACYRLGAIPVRLDARTGTVDLAVVDARDPHAASEMAYHLRAKVRVVRAPMSAMREALELFPGGVTALAAPMGSERPPGPPRPVRRMNHTPLWGTPIPNWDGRPEALGPRPAEDGVTIAARPASVPPAAEVPLLLTRRNSQGPRASSARPREAAPDLWPLLPAPREGDAEPVFELRKSAGPPTLRDPEPRFESSPPMAAFPLRAPLSARTPIAPNAPSPPFADPSAILSSIKSATDRDAVMGLVLMGAEAVARRVAILVVKKDGFAGWSCTPKFGDAAALRAMKIPLTAPNLLTTILTGGVYLGPLLGSVTAPLLSIMKSATSDVALAVVKVSDKPALVIVADELGDTLLATKRIDELARAAGDALTRIVRAKRG